MQRMVLLTLIRLTISAEQYSLQGRRKCIWRLEAGTSDEPYETQDDRRPSWGAFRQSQMDFILWLEVKLFWFVTLFSQKVKTYSIINSMPGSSFHREFTNGFWISSKLGHSKAEWEPTWWTWDNCLPLRYRTCSPAPFQL